jgi:hypothetical protein
VPTDGSAEGGDGAGREPPPLSFEAWANLQRDPYTEEQGPVRVDVPFDLFFRLVRSKSLWEPNAEPLDVPTALGKLTRRLDKTELELFKQTVDRATTARGFLRRSDFGRWTKGPNR